MFGWQTQRMPTPSIHAPGPHPVDAQRYRGELCRQRDALQLRVEAVEQDYNAHAERADKEIAAARNAVSDLTGPPTEMEWVTFRAAQVDRDLVQARHAVTLHEKMLATETLVAERDELDLRIGQVDHMMEVGAAAAGNDAQLAILMLDVQESAGEQQHAMTALDYARRRLTLTKRMHREIHATLRKLQRAAV